MLYWQKEIIDLVVTNVKKFYVALGRYLKRSDTFLLVLCLISTVYGMVLISSAIRYSGSLRSLYVQIAALIIGLFMYFIFSVVDIDIIASRWRPLTVFGLLLILSLRWLGSDVGGNRAWIRFGGIGIQPAEFVKIIFIITMAYLMTRAKDAGKLDKPLTVIGLGLLLLVHFGLIVAASSDTGSALVYLFVFLVMIFAAGIRFYWIAGAAAGLALLVPYIWYYFLNDNYRNRILAIFIPTEIDPTGQGVTWQTNLSKAAIAGGGLFGQGLYRGSLTQSNKLPLQSSDFIFSVAGEEFGIFGCALVLILLTAIIIRCVHVGLRSQSRLGALVCIGVGAMVAFHMLENVGMCIGVAPVIGLTLPFFSYGGSSIVTLYAAMGIVSGIKMRPRPMMFLR